MKPRSITRLRFVVITAALVLGAVLLSAANRSPSHQFQEAIDLMETKGDYPAAIRLFEELAKGPDRALAARSLLYAGLCYEKLGKDEAQKAYQRLIREFAEQSEAVAEARTRLAALVQPAGSDNHGTMTVRRVWASPDANDTGSPSLDGRYLSFVDWETGDLAVRDLMTGEKRHLTNKGSWYESSEFAEFSKISPDSKLVAYAWFTKDSLYELRIAGLDGSGPRVLYSNKELDYVAPAAWSPDGKHILATFFRKDRTTQIVLVSVADSSVRVLKTLDWRYPDKMSFSADGRYIAYDFPPKEDSPNRDIYLLAADGSRETRLVEHPANDLSPAWAPDGKRILFASDRTGSMGLWVIQVADGKPQGQPELVKPDVGRTWPMGFTRRGSFYYGLEIGETDVYTAALDVATGKLLDPPTKAIQRFVGSNSAPDWSPDGQYLAYISQRGFDLSGLGRVISIRSFKTGEEREISPRLNYLQELRWSPDGRSILVTGNDKKSRQGLYRIDAQTGNVTPIVQSEPGGFINQAAWSADAKAIFYRSTESSTKSSRIAVRDLETSQDKELYRAVSLSSIIKNVALSPDGRRLAFTMGDALMVMPSTGGEPRELFKVKEPDEIHWRSTTWTPDSRQIIFGTGRYPPQSPKTQLWRISADGGEPQKLGLAMEFLRDLRFHPDAKRIAFSAGLWSNEVWVMENFLPVLKAAR